MDTATYQSPANTKQYGKTITCKTTDSRTPVFLGQRVCVPIHETSQWLPIVVDVESICEHPPRGLLKKAQEKQKVYQEFIGQRLFSSGVSSLDNAPATAPSLAAMIPLRG